MPQIGLTTFMKLWAQHPSRKEQEYRRYLTPGGYDYYWSMKRAAAALTYGGLKVGEALRILAGIKREAEHQNNLAGITSLSKFLDGLDCSYFAPPRGLRTSPKGELTVKVEPQFGVKLQSERRLVTLWNTKSPEMTMPIATVGISLMFDALARDQFGDCTCSILVLRTGKWFVAERTTDEMRTAILRELEWIDRLFEKFRSERAA
jgi:hypothetical protein